MDPLEPLAVTLALTYLLLAIRQNPWCWIAAASSAVLYIFIMYRADLYLQSALQFFYIGMAVYGWRNWRYRGADNVELLITSWPPVFHVAALALIVLMSMLSGSILSATSDAVLPHLESFTTLGPLVATWMVARKILQNWHYWFAIDSASIFLFAAQGLWPTVGLFVCYLVLIVFGYRAWRRDFASRS